MENDMTPWRGTTILSVRKGNEVVVAGDGQVSMGNLVLKSNVRKVRRVGKGDVIAGFAGSTADALALFERLEVKLDQNPHQLVRACVDLAKDWRRDRYLRRLEAMMAVVSPLHSLMGFLPCNRNERIFFYIFNHLFKWYSSTTCSITA